MNLLAVDTTTDYCSVALACDGKLYTRAECAPREHAQRLLPMIEGVLTQANCKIIDLTGIAVTEGPGTFTGVRTGLSVAQGLALPHGTPLYLISSLLVLAVGAHRQWGHTALLTTIDARMNEVYYAGWALEENAWHPILPTSVTHPTQIRLPDDLSRWHGVGTGWEVYRDQFPAAVYDLPLPITPSYPLAEDMISLVLHHPHSVHQTDALHAEPCYIRNEVAAKQVCASQ